MTIEIMKSRVEKELIKMGCNNPLDLIEKYWNQVGHLETARNKALYMIA